MRQSEANSVRAEFNAFADGKAIEWQEIAGGPWMRCTDNFSFDAAIQQGQKVRIAKERQILPGKIGDYDVFLDSNGVHVGCTTISFERVHEIYQTCRNYQGGAS